MKNKMIWLSAVALSMSVSQATLACPNATFNLSGEHHAKLVDKLDLTAEQKTKLHAIKMQAKETLKPKIMEMRALSMQLSDLAKAKVLDHGKIDKLIDQKKELMGSIMKIRVDVRHQISMVLTDAQKAKLDAMITKWKEKHAKKACEE